MEYALVLGLTMWMVMAFLGTRDAYRSRQGPMYSRLASIKRRSPNLLAVAALVLAGLAGMLVLREIAGLQHQAGVLGLYFAGAVLFGVAGAVCLSARLYIED